MSTPEDPQPGLSELERRDFVAHLKDSSVQNDEEYSFNHILMRDVAYGQVPKGLRAQLHLGFTEWVKDLPGKADEFVEIVAWHLEQACLLAREVTRSPIEPPVRERTGWLSARLSEISAMRRAISSGLPGSPRRTAPVKMQSSGAALWR